MADEDLGLRPLEAATQTEDSDLGLRPLDETAGMRPVGPEATSAHPYLAAAARVVPALVGGIGGSVLGPGGTLLGGAAGGALGEVIAQLMEKRNSPGQVALSAALGAIPGIPLAKSLGTVARVGLRTTEAAGIGAAGQVASNMIDGRPALENVPTAALVGAPFGLAGGLVERALHIRAAKAASPFEALVSQAEAAPRSHVTELLDVLPRTPERHLSIAPAQATEEELLAQLMSRETPEQVLARRGVAGFEPVARPTTSPRGVYETPQGQNRFNEEAAAEALAMGRQPPQGKYGTYDLAPALREQGAIDVEALRSHAIQMQKVYNPEGLAERLIERSAIPAKGENNIPDALYPKLATKEYETLALTGKLPGARPARRTTEVGAKLMGMTPDPRAADPTLPPGAPTFRKELGPLQALWNYVGKNSTREIAGYGKFGDALAKDVRTAADRTEADYARVFVGDPVANVKPHDYLDRLRALSTDDATNLGHVLNDGAAPRNPTVAQLAAETQVRTREVGLRAADAKLKIRNRATGETYDWVPLEGSYYPNRPDFDAIERDPSARTRTIQEIQADVSGKLARQGKTGISVGEATNIYEQMRRNSRMEYGNLENARLVKLSTIDYDARKVLPDYFEKAYKRINEAEVFGAQNERAYNKVNAVGIEYGDLAATRAKNYIDRITGRSQLNANEQAVARLYPYGNAFEVVTKLPLAFINNASQSSLTAMKIGYGNTLKTFQGLMTEGGQDFAKLAAGTLDQIMRDIQGIAGPSKVADVVLRRATPFATIESFNRRFAALGGKIYAEDLLARLRDPSVSPVQAERLRRGIREMGIEPMEVLGRGAYTLDELYKAGRYLKNTTQFQTNVKDLPLGWTAPYGRFLAQLSNFGFKSGEFIWNDIFKEAGRYAASGGKTGNIQPFVRYLLTAPVVGEVFADVSSAIKGTDRPENVALRQLENVAYIGGLGIAYDAWRAALYGTTSLYRRLVGPQLSDVIETVGAGVTAAKQGSAKPLLRQAKALSPVAGMIIRRTEEKP